MARSKPSEPGSDEVRMAEYRLERGWTAYEANKWLGRGLPVVRKPRFRGDDHIVSRKAVTDWLFGELEKALDPARSAQEVGPDGKPIVFEVERARLTKEQADKTELENRRLRGELVSASEIEAALAALDVAVKDRLLAVPMAAADRAFELGGKVGPQGIAEVYREEIDAALEALSSDQVVAATAH